MFIYCQNYACKFYWEDSCTEDLENKMVSFDSEGKCSTFKPGTSDYYQKEDE